MSNIKKALENLDQLKRNCGNASTRLRIEEIRAQILIAESISKLADAVKDSKLFG